jgi:hypothetical protein
MTSGHAKSCFINTTCHDHANLIKKYRPKRSMSRGSNASSPRTARNLIFWGKHVFKRNLGSLKKSGMPSHFPKTFYVLRWENRCWINHHGINSVNCFVAKEETSCRIVPYYACYWGCTRAITWRQVKCRVWLAKVVWVWRSPGPTVSEARIAFIKYVQF